MMVCGEYQRTPEDTLRFSELTALRPMIAAPTLEKAAPASTSLQTASCQYVYKRYGELGAAMTANVITYRGKVRSARSRGPADIITDLFNIAFMAVAGPATIILWTEPDPRDSGELSLVEAPIA
jgi:hypothetical protein